MRFDVVSFEAENAVQAQEIVDKLSEEVKATLEREPGAKYQVHVRMGEKGNPDAKLDRAAYMLADQVASIDKNRISLSQSNVPVDPAIKKSFAHQRFWQKNYRMTFALIRGFVNWGATTGSLMVTAHIPMGVAATVGLFSGLMSFGIQNWTEKFYDWATDTGLFARILTRHRDPKNRDIQGAPVFQAIHFTEEQSRWYLTEVVYALILKSAMTMMAVDSDFKSLDSTQAAMYSILGAAGFALFAQGTWDFAITNTRKRAERLKDLTKNQIDFRANLKYLSISGAAIMLLVAQLLHVPNTSIASVGMGAIGATAYLRSLWLNRKMRPREATAAERTSTLSCEIYLQKVDP